MSKISLKALEKTIAAMHAAEPAGPMTTFPRNADDTPGDHAHVAIVCSNGDLANWTDVIRWIDAMVKQVPALVEIAKAALASRAPIASEADARDRFQAEQRLDATLAKVTR